MPFNAEQLDRERDCADFDSSPMAEEPLPFISHSVWDPMQFGKEQRGTLVRQVFFRDSSKPVRQVVFSAMSSSTEVGEICMRVGEALSNQVSGSVCVIASNFSASLSEKPLSTAVSNRGLSRDSDVRGLTRQIAENLWVLPASAFMATRVRKSAALRLGARLSDLREQFDYSIVEGPFTHQSSQLSQLGQLCDGVVLVFEANSTRRVTAQRMKETLRMENVPLLGIVLNNREFPIPGGLYAKL